MDLSLSPQDLAFQAEVRAWMEETLPEGSPYRGLNLFTQDRAQSAWWQQALNKRGWGCVAWPEEFGGTGWNDAQKQIFSIESARAEAPMQSPFGETMVGPVIYTFGTEEQKAQHLPSIRDGSIFWCQGYSEPGSGSDLASLRTSAVRDGDDYIVNGQKIWTTQAHFADWIFCLVRTKTDGKPQEGISFLLIDMKTPGVEVKPIYTIDGEHHLNEVYFSDARVPVSNLVGEENMGWTYAKFLLMNERVGIAGTGRLRTGLGNLKAIHNHLNETGAESYDGDDLARKHAELSVRLEALEMLESRALTAEEGSGESMILPLPLKLLGTHLQQDVADLGVEILGYSAMPRTGHGFGDDASSNEPQIRSQGPSLTSFMLSGRAATIYGGSSEVQRGIMSKFVLGL
ncbi:acyl-CoA dehydrogenase family protein [Alphaproteobacteria bacterium]|nr:acyl-CoA dehydrogenase family protein [Alphaproteobacteria bacterium]MDC0147277.1 acyl-CoA dehydrogenase family protein [Alphaproteobacteria bacterium]